MKPLFVAIDDPTLADAELWRGDAFLPLRRIDRASHLGVTISSPKAHAAVAAIARVADAVDDAIGRGELTTIEPGDPRLAELAAEFERRGDDAAALARHRPEVVVKTA